MIRLGEVSINLTSQIESIEGSAQLTLDSTVQSIRKDWIDLAKSRLNSTAKSYISGIYSTVGHNSNGFYATIGLKGKWPNMLESGFPAYDMRTVFGKSSKRMFTKEGEWYMHIPFRHFTPQSGNSSSMSHQVYREARKMPQWGRMSTQDPKSHQNNMVRVPQGSKSTYMTWRTISQKDAGNSWMHPGFSGVHIARDLSSRLDDTFTHVFQSNSSYIQGLGRR